MAIREIRLSNDEILRKTSREVESVDDRIKELLDDIIYWNVSDYESFKNNRQRRKAFAEWGADLPTMLDGQMISDIDSWAVIWCYEAFRHDMLTVYPKKFPF